MSPAQEAYYRAHHVPWQAGFGDPGVGGWVSVAGYVLAAGCALAALARARREPRDRGAAGAFLGIAMLLVLLGINKQLDLQTWLTHTLREQALAQGWYRWRRLAQGIGFAAGAVVALAAGWWAWRHVRGADRWVRRATAGTGLLIAYVAMRAARFTHVIEVGGEDGLGSRALWLLELAALAVIALAAWRYRQRGG